MNWSKHKIEIKDLKKFHQDYLKVIKKGEADLEHCYVIYKYKDNPIIYTYNIFDFIDNYTNIINFLPLSILYFCQPKNVKPNT